MFLSLCILLFNMLLCNKFNIFQVNIPLLLFRLFIVKNCLFESSSTVKIFPCDASFALCAWPIHDTRETQGKKRVKNTKNARLNRQKQHWYHAWKRAVRTTMCTTWIHPVVQSVKTRTIACRNPAELRSSSNLRPWRMCLWYPWYVVGSYRWRRRPLKRQEC